MRWNDNNANARPIAAPDAPVIRFDAALKRKHEVVKEIG
jgi:hypothetical protein